MNQVVPWCTKYCGLPFAEKGRDLRGFDCWGLVRWVLAAECDVELPMLLDGYSSTTDTAAIARLVAGEKPDWLEVDEGAARPGDVVLFRVGRDEAHVGVVVGRGHFLHVTRDTDACVERWRDLRWAQRFVGIFRHVELAQHA